MLVLSRREGEVVVIAPGTAHECRVKVECQKGSRRGHIKLTFTADKSVLIVREELLEGGLRP